MVRRYSQVCISPKVNTFLKVEYLGNLITLGHAMIVGRSPYLGGLALLRSQDSKAQSQSTLEYETPCGWSRIELTEFKRTAG